MQVRLQLVPGHGLRALLNARRGAARASVASWPTQAGPLSLPRARTELNALAMARAQIRGSRSYFGGIWLSAVPAMC